MNYLENMGENLELLDLVKKCNVTTYSLRSIRDKNTAIKNLKGLRVELLRVSPSYMRENPCELVKTEVLNHAEAVETINLLGEEDTLNLEDMILLGSFFSEHIPYDRELLRLLNNRASYWAPIRSGLFLWFSYPAAVVLRGMPLLPVA